MTNPISALLTTSNGRNRPVTSFLRSNIIAHSKIAMLIKSELSAMWRPTRCLDPKLYEKCPSFLRSDISREIFPLTSRYRAGSKSSVFLPKISGSRFTCHAFAREIVPLGKNISSYQSSSATRCPLFLGAIGLQRKSSLTIARVYGRCG